MHFPLRTLKAALRKTVRVETTEVSDDPKNKEHPYVFRGSDGEPFMWSPRPYRFEHHPVNSVAEADNISFLCPLCFERNGGEKGTHSVFVSFAGRNDPPEAGSRDSNGNPSRWNVSGNGLDDLVLTPSIAIDVGQPNEVGCHWHGFVGSSGIPAGHAG